MVEDSAVRAELLQRVRSRRAGVQAFLNENRPRVRRRVNITIVLSTLAALSTAGPAVGGETFAGNVQHALGLASDSYVWRTLCLIAMLVSIAAAVLTNLNKSQDQGPRLAIAEAADGELEGLAVLLEFGELPVQDAVKLYQQYTGKISFIPEAPATGDGRPLPVGEPVAQPTAGRVAGPPPADRARRTSGSLPAVPPSHRRHTDDRQQQGPPPPR